MNQSQQQQKKSGGDGGDDGSEKGAGGQKLAKKGVDLLVANDVSAPGVGFEHDTNAVVVLRADGTRQNVALTDKYAVAGAVLDAVLAVRPGV